MSFPVLFFLLLGCFISWFAIYGLLQVGFGSGNRAQPQHHHTHKGVIPRIGGVGIVLGFVVTYLLCFFLLDEADDRSLQHYCVTAGAIGAFLLGFVDDLCPLGAKLKLLIQIGIGLVAYYCGLSVERVAFPLFGLELELGFLGILVTVFWYVALMNLINLIDGLDGLAGGIGLMLMVLLAFLSFSKGSAFSFILSLGMIGALLGFLFHNFPPAKVYMGDSGAYMIGFVIGAISLLNSEKGAVLAALVAPILALALPIVDVGYAILRRGIKGLPLFRPDREHIHHRLIRTGLSHRNTVLVLYSVSLVALLGGLLSYASQGRYLPIFLGFSFVVILFAFRGQKISANSLRAYFDESVRSRQDNRNALALRDWFVSEVERAGSGADLWSDFQFVLKKMGFSRAVLTVGEEQKEFSLTTERVEDKPIWGETISLRGELPAILVLNAEEENFTHGQFSLLADIAAESWSKATARWFEINGGFLSFDAKAKEPVSKQRQKVRKLYRPTY